jgi:hypothetical protein
MIDNITNTEIPMGLSMALAQNLNALNRFASFDKEKQQQIIEHTHQIQSKEEMQQYVSTIASSDSFR